jgi:hypothetical protein
VNINEKKKRGIAATIVAGVVFLIISGMAYAVPRPAMELYGTVLLHGADASIGTTLSVVDSTDLQCGSSTMTKTRYFGLLSCNGDDIETLEKDGASDGELVHFKANGGNAYIINGNNAWNSGNYSFLEIFGLKNSSPYLYGCLNSTTPENSPGSNISVDIWDCAFDRTYNISDMSYIVSSETNSQLISCNISGNRFLTCNDPANFGNGISFVKLTVTNPLALSWSADVTVTVSPVNYPPYFVQNLTSQYGFDGTQFEYDINCSDPDGDTVYYYDNTSLFEVNPETGVITFIPSQQQIGNHSIMITCGDEHLYTDANFTLSIINVNNPPVLGSIGNLQGRSGIRFIKRITATDPDNDTLTFSTDTNLFKIDPETGLINFTPELALVGNYTINISVTDGLLSDFEVINFTIWPGAFCGDVICQIGESCLTCPTDCGACPSGSGDGTSQEDQSQTGANAASSESGGTSTSAGAQMTRAGGSFICIERWTCGEWQPCEGDNQRRMCRDINKCGTSQTKPEDKRMCQEKQQQEPPSCFDGTKNQGEEDVDCGGPCKPCGQKIFATLPIPKISLQLQKLMKQFPFTLLVAILIITVITITSDQAHLHRLRRLPLEKYREQMRKYRPKRRIIYRILLNLLMLTLITSIYMYWFSDCTGCIKRYLLPLGLVLITVPFIVAVIINKIEFSEYKRAALERRLAHTHEQQISQMIRLETKLSLEIEEELLTLIKEYNSKFPENDFMGITQQLFEISGMHSRQLDFRAVDKSILEAVEAAIVSRELKLASREDFELKQLIEDCERLLRTFKSGEPNKETETNFTQAMEEIASNKALTNKIALNEQLSETYNNLVDTYSYILHQHSESKKALKNELLAETELLKLLVPLFENKALSESKGEDTAWVRIYNLLVDLNDHYQKKQENSGA